MSCIQCDNNFFKSILTEKCEQCPQGAYCSNGLLYNLEGLD